MRVREALLRFYDAFSSADMEAFGEVISWHDEGVLVIGTDPGDWAEGRQKWLAAREAMRGTMWEGLQLVPGDDPRGYEQGSLGWVHDQPRVVMEDGTAIPTRLTGVLRDEDGKWRFVHVHLSVGVPDDEVVDLQRRWSS